MDAEPARLVFLTDPFSPAALLAGSGLVALLAAHSWSVLRSAGMRRGAVLVALRGLSLLTLAGVLLRPSLLEHEPVAMPLPDLAKEVRVFDPGETDALVPPVSSLPLPEPPAAPGVKVSGVAVPPVAFYKGRTVVRILAVNNSARPQSGQMALFRLERNGRCELARKEVTLEPGEQEVPVELVPDVLGSAAYAVFLERFPEGGASDDDFAVFPMLAARDSTRVLHIAGHPSWDVRFLRQFLTGTPGMELVSFYLLVEAEDFAPHSREELALIPFPTDELFLRELGNFDLVIVHNFPLGSYFLLKETHLRRLVRFVEEGGGVLFIGGDKAFSLGALQGSPAAALLPAGLPAAEEPDLYVQGPADAVLEPEGLTHPVTTTRSGDEEIPLRLAGLPPLAGVSRLGEVAGWGQLLASARVGGRSHPLLVAGRYGKGRVLALSTDSLWKWAFPAELSHESPAVYRTLLLNALAWLVRDPRMDEAAVLSESGVLAERKEGVVRVCIRGAAQPGTVARVEAEWLDASGKLPSLRLDLTAPLSDGRCARVSFPPAPPGAWLVTASLESDNREFEGSATLVVERRRETWLSEFMRRLRPLLEVRFVPFVLDPVYPVVPGLSKMVLHKPVVRPLWDTPVPFAALVVFLAAEWLLRRRWGYL